MIGKDREKMDRMFVFYVIAISLFGLEAILLSGKRLMRIGLKE